MDRAEFEKLREIPGKVIREDIKMVRCKALTPVLTTRDVPIENDLGYDLRLHLKYNPEVGEKTVCVVAVGIGPICRVDIDGHEHKDKGRSHKHTLQTERCPDRNLSDSVEELSIMSGQDIQKMFHWVCRKANIKFLGKFELPDLD